MLAILLAAFAACSSFASARPIPHSTRLYRRFTFEAKPSPHGWATVQLEDYDQYHFRYLDIGCHLHHSTAFFTACCHPRKKSDSPADFPAECSLSPSSLAAAASIIDQSTGAAGEVKQGKKGKGIHVQAGAVVALKPVKVNGKVTNKPPTAGQLKAYAEAEAALHHSKSKHSRPKLPSSPTKSSTSSSSSNAQAETKAKAAAAAAAASASAQAQAKAQAQAQAQAAQASKSAAAAAAQQSSAASAEQAKEQAQAAAAAAAAKAKAEAEAQAQAAAQAAAEKAKQQQQEQQQQEQQQQKQQQQQQQQQQQSQSQQSSGGGGGGGGFFAGIAQIFGVGGGTHATFFYQNGVAGNCGTVHPDSTPLIALPDNLYDGGSHCGQSVKILNPANGKSVVAQVQDRCPTCTGDNSIDLSVGAFTQIATEDQGQVDIQWGFVN